MDIKTSNGIIESTMLGIEDHGILTFILFIGGDGCTQGFGGIALDVYDKFPPNKRKGKAEGFVLIRAILETLDVKKWEELLGTHCRIKHTYSKIYSIGHILNDKWVNIDDYAKI